MERLTKRISVENEEVIFYTKGEYFNTTAGEMKSSDVREVMRKLAEYEELEEQGLLLKLPCKIGDTVYAIDTIYECKHDYLDCPMDFPDAYQCEINCKCEYEYEKLVVRPIIFKFEMLKDFNKKVFLTKEEAEQELKRLECAE